MRPLVCLIVFGALGCGPQQGDLFLPAGATVGYAPVGFSSGLSTFTAYAGSRKTSPLALTVDDPKEFVISEDGCTGRVLDADEHCSFGATFWPSAIGDRTGTITLREGSHEMRMVLQGLGLVPAFLTAMPNAIDLGLADSPSGYSPTIFVTVANAGPGSTGALSLLLDGPDPGDVVVFSTAGDCGYAELGPGASCVVPVALQPRSLGDKQARLRVTDGFASAEIQVGGRAVDRRKVRVVSYELTGSGSVVVSTPTTCSFSTDCEGLAEVGKPVTLTATAGLHSSFAGWSLGPCVGTAASCTFNMPAESVFIRADFQGPVLSAQVSAAGGASGNLLSSSNSLGQGLNCSSGAGTSGCSVAFRYGDVAQVFPSGTNFAGWSGACSGTGACMITMTADRQVTASFNP